MPQKPACLLFALALLAGGCHEPMRAITNSTVTSITPPMLDNGPLQEFTVISGDGSGERIGLIDVDGVLLNSNMTGMSSYGENPVAIFREKLDFIAANSVCYRGVIVRINSPGGGVTASDIMRRDLMAFKARTGMPVVACLLDVGAGGAYYLATAADHVVAHPTCVTGGIGVILNLYNLADLLRERSITGVPIKSGDHIDMGTPIKEQSEDVRRMLQVMANEFHYRFRFTVEQSRPGHDPRHIEDFDGRVFTASQALERRLIDSIGYLDDAVAVARLASGRATAPVILLHRCRDRARSPYAVTPNVPIQATAFPMSVPGLERSRLPTFLYLWEPDPTLERWGGR